MRSATMPLDKETIARIAPSVLTTEKAPTLFDDYKHVSSWNVLEALLDSGYGISRVQQISSKGDKALNRFAKHIVCLRPLDAFGELVRGEYIHEIVYTAAHDGSTAIHLGHGLFRVVCANGMMTSAGNWKTFRMKHIVGAEQQAILAAKELVLEGPALAARVEHMQRVELGYPEQREFARRALPLRFAETASAYDPGVLLMQRRLQDAGNDLWRVLNRIQENLIKGGFESAPGPKGRTVTIQEVSGINSDVAINTGLWALAEEYAA